ILTGNVAPTISGPTAQTVGTGPFVFSAARGNAITVADPDGLGNTESVYLQTVNGTLTAVHTSGLASITGNGTHALGLTGTLAALNSALDGLRFQSATGTTWDYLSALISDAGNTNGRARTGS